MKKILILALLALASAAHADGPPMAYGYLYPDGSLPRAEWSTTPLPPKAEAEVVEIDAEAPPEGMMSMPENMPTTYDPATRHAIPWQAEIDRQAVLAAKVEQDCSAFTGAIANALQQNTDDATSLDVVDADLSTLIALPDSSLDTAAKLRTAVRALARSMSRLSVVQRHQLARERKLARFVGRKAQVTLPSK